MDYKKWMRKGLETLKRMESDQIFELKDLFTGSEWKQLTRGEKINFGKYFSNAVSEREVSGIIKIEKGKDNHNRYKLESKFALLNENEKNS